MTENSGSPSVRADTARGYKSKINARIRQQAQQDVGAPDSVRRSVLSAVADERYDEALAEMKQYALSKPEYIKFGERSQRYFNYSQGLIYGIKAKRSFPGVNMLSMGKQQELYEKAMDHFEDLRATLKKIEQIEREVRLEDIRSTVWVVKALVYSVTAILVVAFLAEVSRGVLPTAASVADGAASDATEWIFTKFGI